MTNIENKNSQLIAKDIQDAQGNLNCRIEGRATPRPFVRCVVITLLGVLCTGLIAILCMGLHRWRLLSRISGEGSPLTSRKLMWRSFGQTERSRHKWSLQHTLVIDTPCVNILPTEIYRRVMLPFIQFTEINLWNDEPSPIEDSQIQAAIIAPGVKRLSLSKVKIDNDTLGKIVKGVKVRALKLHNCRFSLRALFECSPDSHLNELELIGCPDLKIDTAVTCGFPIGLRTLIIYGNIDASDAAIAASMCNLNELESIVLASEGCGPETLAVICRLPKLRTIHLLWSEIKGSQYRPLLECPSVEEIVLSTNDVDMNTLSTLVFIPTLKTLGVPIRCVSEADRTYLANLRPSITIRRFGIKFD